jgi:hypothetical protein
VEFNRIGQDKCHHVAWRDDFSEPPRQRRNGALHFSPGQRGIEMTEPNGLRRSGNRMVEQRAEGRYRGLCVVNAQ